MPEERQSEAYLKLIRSRKYLRQRVTRIYNIVCGTEDAVNAINGSTYLETLKVIKMELMECDKEIHSHIADDEALALTLIEEQESYELKIAEAINRLENDFPSNISRQNSSNMSMESAHQGIPHKLKLPDVTLPVFCNDKKESLEKFIYSFESIIDKHVLSSYEKFIYLKNQLRGSPKVLIDSMSTDEQNYDTAKQLLVEAFASVVTQKFDVIERLAKLKLDSGTDPYEFIGDMRSIVSSFSNLNISIDDILQCFIWSALNDRFQSQLIQITNNSKPTLAEIKTHIFTATERYIKISERINDNKSKHKYKSGVGLQNRAEVGESTNNFAVNVRTKSFIPCWLCMSDGAKNVEHVMKQCTKYDNPIDKVNKLKSLKYCSYCSFKNHSTENCKFKFSSKCRVCNGNHLSWLCTKVVSENIQNKLSVVQTLSVDCLSDEILLPSFTCDVVKNDECLNVRILKDSGTQRNFITECVVNDLGLRILKEDIKLSINGFNSVKHIKTNLVSVPLRVDNSVHFLEAVVVPSLDINMNIPCLSALVSKFESKGYTLADSRLNNSNISQFSMVVGSDIDPILVPSTLVFGKLKKSSVQQTTIGILFSGNAELLLENIQYLSEFNDGLNMNNVLKSSCTVNVAVCDVLDSSGTVHDKKLELASEENLNEAVNDIMNYDNSSADDGEVEINQKITDYILSNSDRDMEGRLIMPLPWNPETKHLLSTNLSLSKKILMANLKKLQKTDKLMSYNQVFKEQEELNIIEKVGDVNSFLDSHPGSSILPHMGVYRTSSESTKVRVVFLSNLSEKTEQQPNGVSHNVALLPGPCINHKLVANMIMGRFNKYLLLFDIVKAFLQISLNECDQNRLLFLWFNSVEKGDFSMVAYRCKRLPFGLRPSPTILMLSLYKILILDIDNDPPDVVNLKKLIYSSMYVDNGGVSSDSPEYITWAYSKLNAIFGAYNLDLQQYATNNKDLQLSIDNQFDIETEDNVKFFGMQWNISTDTLSANPINLDAKANTLRKLLASLHSVYDPFGIYCPIMNRSKLFYQKLQAEKSLSWDTKVPEELQSEWRKISRQANSTPIIKLPRYLGPREGSYTLVAFSDSSASIYGAVVYAVETNINKMSFLLAKNRVVGNKHSHKTIPSLELQGICFATEILSDIYNELSGKNTVLPVRVNNFIIYTDSMVCLSWIKSYFVSHTKMQKKSVFVQNRLKQIGELCKSMPVTYRYIEGKTNPADYVTRLVSHNILQKTNYLSGPEFLVDCCEKRQPDIEITVPCVSGDLSSVTEDRSSLVFQTQVRVVSTPVVEPVKYSRLSKLMKVYTYVLKFVNILKQKIKKPVSAAETNILREHAFERIVISDQGKYFPDIIDYFSKRRVAIKNIPPLVLQLNLFVDSNSVIRVKSKFNLLNSNYPILMHPDSHVTKLIIEDYHTNNSHAGLFITLREIKRKFWILRGFSTTKKLLKNCITCRKLNGKPIKLNQNTYRDFRSSPPQIPFRSVFLDYIGPFYIKVGGQKRKCWLLIVCCIWSRAINIEVCLTADVNDFLRAVQSHVYKYGMFELCISDLGSQITAGSNLIRNYLDDHITRDFLANYGIMNVKFNNYPKGDSSMGGIIEICVKQTKNLINKTISKGVLNLADFQLLITKVIHVINRRPIAFQENLRESQRQLDFPEPITPEQLLRGYELVPLDVIPQLTCDDSDPSYRPSEGVDRYQQIQDNFLKLRKANKRLREVYHSEYLQTLFRQGVDAQDRYKPVMHSKLKIGDIVLLVEENCKQVNYPMGIVTSVKENRIGEVTAAEVVKGKTREKVYRSANSLILLYPNVISSGENSKDSGINVTYSDPSKQTRTSRKAAIKCRQKCRDLIDNDFV